MVRISVPLSFSFLDFPTPEGTCISVYFTGCSHFCDGCQNKEFQNQSYNKNTVEILNSGHLLKFIKYFAKKHRTNNVCLMGGDPLYKTNKQLTYELVKNKEFNWCVYTGYEYTEFPLDFIKNCSYIKCGKFDKIKYQLPEKTDTYFRLASKNQYIIDSDGNTLTQSGTFYY